jgi:rod shape determining protein RodA
MVRSRHHALPYKLAALPWTLMILLALLATIGLSVQYSVAGLTLEGRPVDALIRMGVAATAMLSMAMIPYQWVFRFSYPFYAITLLLLVYVEIAGKIGMGAQRWIDLKFIHIQPSEMMKLALPLALAQYFSTAGLYDVRRWLFLLPAITGIILPVILVLLQPDLGTATLIAAGAFAVFIAAGVPWRFFGWGLLGLLLALPIAWHYGLHDYQKNRVLTFIDPSRDPQGAGYHITQSKIAFGAGGLWGQGLGRGTQTQLDFIPEKHTDFAFAAWAEETGLIGTLSLVVLCALITLACYRIALRAENHQARLVGVAIATMFFLYSFINMAMVMGLLPVVGIPLPLVSYGGTAMLTLLTSIGLLCSIHIHRGR